VWPGFLSLGEQDLGPRRDRNAVGAGRSMPLRRARAIEDRDVGSLDRFAVRKPRRPDETRFRRQLRREPEVSEIDENPRAIAVSASGARTAK
jgi:hypothetical protein